jgi:uncharacterized protein (TIGR02646 family)
MHSFERTALPDELSQALLDNQTKLNQELKANTDNNNIGKIAAKAWEKFNKKKDIKEKLRDELRNMSGFCCAYCEGYDEDVAYLEVEHNIPKSLFPEHTFDWNNLLYSCPKCNRSKSKKYDAQNKILDPCIDEPVEHLAVINYETAHFFIPGNILGRNSERGKNTIEQCDLNREGLIDSRKQILDMGETLCLSLESASDDNPVKQAGISLIYNSAQHGKEFCTVFRLLIRKHHKLFEGRPLFKTPEVRN